MAMRLPRFQEMPDAPALRDALARCGAAVIERAAPRRAVAKVAAELAPWFERTPAGEGVFFGRKTRRFGAVFAKAPSSAPWAIEPTLFSVLDDILCRPGGDASEERSDCLQLNLTQAISISPTEEAQLLHRDDSLYPFTPGFELMANVMWAIDPFTELNGATRVAPGSHLWDRGRTAEPSEVESATMPAGGALIWLGSTVHGGGANRTTRTRTGLTFSYNLAWLAQAEKLMVTIGPDLARTLPPRLQRLIGYQVHRPNLGWIEGRDPMDWLLGDITEVAATRDNFKPEQELALAALFGANAPEPSGRNL